jgi:four helix bundle protein
MLEKFEAYQIAKKFYWTCKSLKVPRFLQDQLLRASSSVVLNIAEASGKRTPPDQRHYFSIAFGSLRESRAILEMERIEDQELNRLADQLGAILYVLSRKSIPDARRSATATATENPTDTDTDTDTASDSATEPLA